MSCCPHCLRPATGKFCRKCGGKIDYESKQGQLPLGTTLKGTQGRTYQLGAVRGQGGFGITYVAKELNREKRVAIKEYYPTYCAGRTAANEVEPLPGKEKEYLEGKDAFTREAQMLSSVDSLEAVVSIFDYFEANGTLYLVMEYVEGKSLRELVEEEGRIAPEKILPLLEDLFAELHMLHQSGMIHRDISPDNLIMMANGKIKLLDFGSARQMDANRDMTMLLKEGFSPVEQYQHRGQGSWTDVYALAATIYYCLTGCIPDGVLDRLKEDPLMRPSALGVCLTHEQEKALMKALAVHVSARTQDIKTFHNELYRTPDDKVKKNGWKLPVLIGGGVVLLAAAVAAICLISKKPQKNKAQNEETKPPITEECSHEKTSTAYEQLADGEHIVRVICEDDACAKVISEETEACVDEDGDLVCDVCGMLKNVQILEEGYYRFMLSGIDQSYTIVGYMGEEKNVTLPTQLGGGNVTAVSSDAFAGNAFMTKLTVPEGMTLQSNAFSQCSKLEELVIGANCVVEAMAFSDCEKLETVLAYSGQTLDAEAFSDCSALRVGIYEGENAYEGLELRSDFVTYACGMDLNVGKLVSATVEHDIVYGVTEDRKRVVLDFPDDRREIEVDIAAVWITEAAVQGLSENTVIVLGDNTVFPYETYEAVRWKADDNTLAAAWCASCMFCGMINDEAGVEFVYPEIALTKAIMLSVEEIHLDKVTDSEAQVNIVEKYVDAEEISYDSGTVDVEQYDIEGEDQLMDWMAGAAEGAMYDQFDAVALAVYVGDDEMTSCAIVLRD